MSDAKENKNTGGAAAAERNGEPKKKVLVYGAGVIGSYLVHVLCKAGCDVTLAARGRRLEQLTRHGLVSRMMFSKTVFRDAPRVVAAAPENERYDAVFAVMQYIQMPSVLEKLALARAPIAVLVGNNLSAVEMKADIEKKIMEAGADKKTILFGFQLTAGNRDGDVTEFLALNGGAMHLGGLGEEVPRDARQTLDALFCNTGYKLVWQQNMDAYLKHHLDKILPIVWLSYAHGCDLKKMKRREYGLMFDAAVELCDALVSAGIPGIPERDRKWCKRGVRRICILKPIMMLIFKGKMGRLVATDHCRHAVEEMRALDEEMMRMLPADAELSAVHKLRAAMPAWDECERLYGMVPGGAAR